VDPAAVWDYLAYRYVPAPATLFKGIRKLMPGTCAIWQNGRLAQHRYWSPPDGARSDTRQPQGDAVAAFRAHLDEAVQLQMVSDVPFGAFLSGGLDSSVIVALMSRHNPAVNTFSVGFGEAGYSELAYAAQAARHLGTAHHELVVTDRDVIDRLPKLIAFRDAPVSEPSDIPIHMLACEAAMFRMVQRAMGNATMDITVNKPSTTSISKRLNPRRISVFLHRFAFCQSH